MPKSIDLYSRGGSLHLLLLQFNEQVEKTDDMVVVYMAQNNKIQLSPSFLDTCQLVSEMVPVDCCWAAIDEGLAVFGESTGQTIRHLIERSHIQRMEIAKKPQTFHQVLAELFGSGAEIIEKAILEKLREKIGIQFRHHEARTLSEHINEYKKNAQFV